MVWPDVLAAVQDDAARSTIVRSLAEAGFSIDNFARANHAREIVCTCLSRYEDQLECMHHGKLRAVERDAVRSVRRRLEVELWP